VIRALIFDYFDVIRQPGNGLRSAYRRLGGDAEKDEVFLADVTTAAGYGFIADANQQLADKLGVPLEKWLQEIDGALANDPAVLEYILRKRAEGYKIGLLTNTGPGMLASFFKEADLPRYFDAWLTSGDTGHAKPEATFYQMIADKLGVQPSECVMIDDRPEFCRGAEYAGLHAIVYRNMQQLEPELEALIQTLADS
jgi:HAD superfamily hydrolase (TIGR01509 family)